MKSTITLTKEEAMLIEGEDKGGRGMIQFGCCLAMPESLGFDEYIEAGGHEKTITTLLANDALEAAAKYLQMQGMNSGDVLVWASFLMLPDRVEIHDAQEVLKENKPVKLIEETS